MESGHDVGEICTELLMTFGHIQWLASMFLWWTAASPCECGLTYNMCLQDRHCYNLEPAFKNLGPFWCPAVQLSILVVNILAYRMACTPRKCRSTHYPSGV